MTSQESSRRPARVRRLRLAISLLVIGLVTAVAFVVPHVFHKAHASGLGDTLLTITADSTNTVGYITYIDNNLLNGQPEANVQVTQVWPNNYDAHPLGDWYDGSEWTVFNEDRQPIPLGTSFNIVDYTLIGAYDVPLTAFASNTNGAYTYLDNPQVNNTPSAAVFVTQVWTDATMTYNPHEVGVIYNPLLGKWGVFNEDQTVIPAGATFFFALFPSTGGNFGHLHQATAANIQYGYITYIDDPAFNGQPNLMLDVTQIVPWGCWTCVFNTHPIGVWYDASVQRWTIYTVDLASMPAGAEFVLNAV